MPYLLVPVEGVPGPDGPRDDCGLCVDYQDCPIHPPKAVCLCHGWGTATLPGIRL